MEVVTVVGARPQFVKLAPVSRALRARHREVLVHTGQHYDANMSDVFFSGLDLPAPDHHLGIAKERHGARTGAMLEAIEKVLIDEKPGLVLVYGDTDSTLAGALAAAKLGIAVAHVEAGLRSFHRAMPEEVNRVLTDHLSALLFAPSSVSIAQLAKEGIDTGVHEVGDVMLDALMAQQPAIMGSGALARLALTPRTYYFATVHRAENTDDPKTLERLLGALGTLDRKTVLALHPRTRKRATEAGLSHLLDAVITTDPLPYADTIALLGAAWGCLTDSGGMQKEAYFVGTPCVTLRNETEWVETVDAGWNVLATEPEAIRAATKRPRPSARPPLYGDGSAAAKIVDVIDRFANGDPSVASRAWRDRHGR